MTLNQGQIEVRIDQEGDQLNISFDSLPTRVEELSPDYLNEILTSFNYEEKDLNKQFQPMISDAGARHAIIVLNSREALASMSYDMDRGKKVMLKGELDTVSLIFQESASLFHARNPFPVGGIYEDPATGAAAAAFGGYLRDMGIFEQGEVILHQGFDMGIPCVLKVSISGEKGDPITISGRAREIEY